MVFGNFSRTLSKLLTIINRIARVIPWQGSNPNDAMMWEGTQGKKLHETEGHFHEN